MNKQLLAILLVGAAACSAFAQSGIVDPKLIEQAKQSAAQAAGTMSSQSVQIDENGKPVLDANGKPVMVRNSSGTAKDNLRMFQSMTGVQGSETVSGPANSSTAIKSKVSLNQGFDFSCKLGAKPQYYGAASLAFRIDSCAFAGTAVQSVIVSVCDNATTGGSCPDAADYKQTLKLQANAFATFNGLELGVGCGTQPRCRLTVKGSYEIGGNDQTLRDDATKASAKSNIVSDFNKIVTEKNYAGKLTETADMVQKCGNNGSAEDAAAGKYTTCDGKQTGALASAPKTNQSCTTTRTCLKEAVTNYEFTRICTRTFPLTEKTTTLQYTSKATCDIVEYSDPKKGTSTNSCEPKDAPSGTPALNAGMTQVGSTEKECAQTEKQGDESVCIAYKWTAYYVDLQKTTTLSTVSSPSAVGGACDNSPTSSTRTFYCEGSWFGRTLDDSACTVQYAPGDSGPANLAIDYTAKAGCGVCLQPKIGVSCIGTGTPTQNDLNAGADSIGTCGDMDLTGCTRTSAVALGTSGEDGSGVVLSQKETYSCTQTNKACVQWSVTANEPGCQSNDLTMGTDQLGRTNPTTDGSFNNAMAAAAILDGTTQGIEGQQKDQKVPLIFAGELLTCKRPISAVGSWVQKNCCRMDLERPKKGNVIQGGCEMEQVRLSAARRSSYAHYVNDTCSKRLPWPFKTCIQKEERYCVFQGILPRLIQEQGRDQLAAMVSTVQNPAVQESPLSFSYYDNAVGSWAPPVVVNKVKVTAWQWPAYCKDPAAAAQKLVDDPNANDCPGVVTTYFAACDAEAGCGPLPAQPEEGSLNWTIRGVDPLTKVTSALSRYAVATGACSTSTQACSYTVGAWPAGAGGKAVVTKDVSWALYSPQQSTGKGVDAVANELNNVGDLMFKGYSLAGVGGALPATVPLGFSHDGGQTWTTVNLSTALQASETTLPGSDVKLTGSCDVSTNTCTYRATGTASVSNKPWVTNAGIDCSGYTAGQLSVLDFSRMDLSEWLKSVMGKVEGAKSEELVAQANAQFQSFNAMYQTGKVQGTPPVAANFARAVPAEGFGPFEVRLAVSGYWPEVSDDASKNVDRVTRVEVDWGDCTMKQDLVPVDASQGVGFEPPLLAGTNRHVHQYQAPDNYFTCLKIPTEQNITHKITLTVYTSKSGVQTRTLSVENAWSKFPGGKSNNDNVSTPITVTAPKNPPSGP